MNAHRSTASRQIDRPNKITRERFLLMIFTPIHIRPSSNPSTIEDMRWLDALQFSLHPISVFHAHGRHVDIASLAAKQSFKVAGHPAAAAPNEEIGGVHARHCCRWSAGLQCKVIPEDLVPDGVIRGIFSARDMSRSLARDASFPRCLSQFPLCRGQEWRVSRLHGTTGYCDVAVWR